MVRSLCRFVSGAILLAVAGCSQVDDTFGDVSSGVGSRFSASETFFILDGVSVINTQKTIGDHVVSLVTGKDCSLVRASVGDPYCTDPLQPVPSIPRITYCYQSLARVSCFDRPIDRDANRLVGTRLDVVPIVGQ
jgi:hypothetical protein